MMKEMTTNFRKLDKFEGHDFRRWQKKMNFLLTTLKVVYVLTTPMPELWEDATMKAIRIREKWENDDNICMGHILNGMFDSFFDVYTNVESAKELWESLESKYMAEDSSCKKFLDFKHTLKHGKDDLSLVQLGSHLRIEESLRVQDNDKGKGKEVAGPSVNMTKEGKNKNNKQNKGKKHDFKEHGNGSGSNKKPKLECWKCDKTGHFKRDCHSGKKNNVNAGGSGKGSKDHSQDQGQNLVNVWNSFVKYSISLIPEAFYMQVDAIAWWIDSGATTHVCKDRCWFKTFEPMEDGYVLYMGDEHFALVHGKGSVALEFSSGKTVTLFNVLYVPKLRKNLVSGPVLNKCRYKQVYESDKYILEKCGVFVGFSYYNNGMFMLNLNKVPDDSDSVYMSSSSTVVNTSVWHARLRHVHYERMLEMSKDEMIPAIDENPNNCTTSIVWLSDPKRKTLGEKAIDCIFVGYAEHSKAYRFYVIEPNDYISTNSIIESRDAIFDENRFSSIPRPKNILPNVQESQRDDHSDDVPSEISKPRKGYSDVSWINHVKDSSSTSGWVFLLGGGAISWASKKQTCITGSTMEYEFVALAAAGTEGEWLRNLIHEILIWSKPIAPISIRCDSAPTMARAYSQIYNGKSRHLELLEDAIVEAIKIRAKWENDYYICRGHILNGMSNSLFDVYTNVESAKELWDFLESKYMAEDSSSKKFLGKGKEVVGPSVNMIEEGKNKNNKQNKGKIHDFKEHGSGSSSSKKPKLECWKCSKTGHFKRDCRSGKKNTANAGGSKKGSKDHSQDQDSGATTHVCKDRCWFKIFEPVEDGSILYMGDEHFAPVHEKGSVALEFSSGKIVTLFNVLYVPKLRKNLVSGPVLNKCGYKQVYESDKYILSKYSVYMSSSFTVVNTSLWHARLGHVYYKRMLEMSKDELIPTIDENPDKCTTCMLTKITRQLFKSITRKSVILELIHSDLYDFHATSSWAIKRIIHETTTPYTPQQNGKAERKNRALKEMVNSMLSYSGLSDGFWGEAMLACYLLNMVPNKRNKATPYELWFYVIEPNDSISINSIIESRDAIFDENHFSSIPRPKNIIPNVQESQRDDHSDAVPSEIFEPRKGKRVRKAKSYGSDFQ
nr:zinc finger, CCHC-type [Tanacetum cinerariifolium]